MSDNDDSGSPSTSRRARIVGGIVRALILIGAIGLVVIFATRSTGWVGSSRFQSTDDAYLESEAYTLAYADGFLLSAIVAAAALIITLTLPRAPAVPSA